MAAIAAATIGSILGFGLPLLKQVAGTYIDADIDLIALHLGFLRATFQDHSELSTDPDAVTKEWLKNIKNLAYDIEDFTDQFLSRFMYQKSSSPLSGIWRLAIHFHIGRQIVKYRKQSAEAKNYFETYKVKQTSAPTTTQKASDEVTNAPRGFETKTKVSMDDAAKESLLQLVTNAPNDSGTKTKVISIIGYSALGNCLLVDKVYETDEVRNQFPLHARVDATDQNVGRAVSEIIEQLSKIQSGAIGTSNAVQVKGKRGIMKQEGAEVNGNGNGDGTSNTVDVNGNGVIKHKDNGGPSNTVDADGNGVIKPEETQSTSSTIDLKSNRVIKSEEDTSGTSNTTDIKGNGVIRTEETRATCGTIEVKGKKGIMKQEHHGRYLIVIDNVNMETLKCIYIGLPIEWGDDSIIIATTDYTKAIHCKCGSPSLDCSTTAQYLIMRELMIKELNDYEYEQETEKRKKELQDVLVNKYNKSLSRLHLSVEKKIINDLEQCLLYFCMFPHDHLVRWNLLKMRYLAEGIAFGEPKNQQEDAFFTPLECLKTFIGQHGIQPIQFRKNGQVKKFQLPVMLLNHISGESKYKSFLTLYCGSTDIDGMDKDESLVRRLSLHQKKFQLSLPNDRKFRRLRTLVVFHTGGIANISELFKYKLLRVLDLKECVNVGLGAGGIANEDVVKICDLLVLRYLSLGDSIGKVPKQIAKLQLLETLAMRKNKRVYVPVELMELPELKHLIGKFQLYRDAITKPKREELLTTSSKLQSLSGFVVDDDSQEFGALMSRMTNLRKVKIWCEARRWTEHVKDAINNFTEKNTSVSLSIECDAYTSEIVKCLEHPGTITSLKLKTNLSGVQVDRLIIGLKGIQVMCLSGTNLRGVEIIGLLKLFPALTHLKLVEKNLGELLIPAGCFYTLKRFCLVAADNLRSITIQDGALCRLVSLHMLFTAPCDLPGIDITNLDCLEEIGLHSGVDKDTKEGWQKKASEHTKKPKVVFIQNP